MWSDDENVDDDGDGGGDNETTENRSNDPQSVIHTSGLLTRITDTSNFNKKNRSGARPGKYLKQPPEKSKYLEKIAKFRNRLFFSKMSW